MKGRSRHIDSNKHISFSPLKKTHYLWLSASHKHPPLNTRKWMSIPDQFPQLEKRMALVVWTVGLVLFIPGDTHLNWQDQNSSSPLCLASFHPELTHTSLSSAIAQLNNWSWKLLAGLKLPTALLQLPSSQTFPDSCASEGMSEMAKLSIVTSVARRL